MHQSPEQVRAVTHEAKKSISAQAEVRQSGVLLKIHRGFTLVELVAVIVILGVIAMVAAPRFFDINTYDNRGVRDQVISTLRYAQKAAIAQRRFICVVISGNAVTLTYDTTPPSTVHAAASCPGNPLTNPATASAPYTVSASNGVTVTAATFNFDALGRPNAPQSITVGGNAPITVETETGYVH
ncbi:hypothetical protein GALL_15620 [mine drainage metagenome]|uniref:Uncharacterized protein n=1 Tax=mine drainage metagenome TaxID=410659 RepID=A0A1J5TBH1_9ZZZZ